MAAVMRVPKEILECILQRVVHKSGAMDNCSIVNALCTCRSWYADGMFVIWKDVVLTNRNLRTFVTTATATNLTLVRSLTVKLEAINKGYCDFDDSGTQSTLSSQASREHCILLDKLGIRMAQFSGLQTFSFTITEQDQPGRAWGYKITRDAVHGLLSKLPTPVENLEIDTKGYEVACCNDGKGHLCRSLNKLLPQLKHLKISVGMLCSTLFQTTMRSTSNDESKYTTTGDCREPVACSNMPYNPPSAQSQRKTDPQALIFGKLKTLIVDVSTPRYIPLPLALCLSTDDMYKSAWFKFFCREGKSERLLQRFARHQKSELLEAALAASTQTESFALTRFSIFDHVQRSDDPTTYNSIIERDFIAGQVHNSPLIQYTGTFDEGFVLRCRNEIGLVRELHGPYKDLMDALTGPAWIETTDGSRFPTEFRGTGRAMNGEYGWREHDVRKMEIDSKEMTTWPGDPLRNLLWMERKARHKLLTVETADDVLAKVSNAREVCYDEADWSEPEAEDLLRNDFLISPETMARGYDWV